MTVGLLSMAHYLPSRVVTTPELAASFRDASGKQVIGARALQRLTGVRERRWAAIDEYSSDLAGQATTKALDRSNLRSEDVDLLIFASASHDVAEPATANRLQVLTGCSNARVLDVKNACNSFLDGLDVAKAMIDLGRVRNAVVATGEVISPFVSLQVPTGEDPMSLLAGLTLGDAGAAAVLVPASDECLATLGQGFFLTFGEHWDVSRIMAGGSMRGRQYDEAYFWSDSAKILGLAIEHVPTVVKQALEAADWTPADVDLVVPHQASVRVIQSICAASGIPFERCVVTAEHLGNTAAASIPVALSIALERGLPAECHRALLVGGAAGFSAAAVPLTLTGAHCESL